MEPVFFGVNPDNSPLVTITSPMKNKTTDVITHLKVQQEGPKQDNKDQDLETKEETQNLWEKYNTLDKRVQCLEDNFYTSSRFSLKVTHAVATTLQLMAQEKAAERLDMEDSKILFKFLLEDWVKVLRDGKGKTKV
jgi:hypothetical protein